MFKFKLITSNQASGIPTRDVSITYNGQLNVLFNNRITQKLQIFY